MFKPVQFSHDEIAGWLQSSFKAISREDVSNAFLVSLESRRLEYRSALGSYAFARYFPDHAYQGENYCCALCGVLKNVSQAYDLSIFNFERYKWGGVRHEKPGYAAFDLERFAKLEKVRPSDYATEIMLRLVETIRQCKPNDKPRDLEVKLGKVVKSNKPEREILIQILSYCGILQPRNRPGYFQSFVRYIERDTPPVNKIDWTYPVCWWRGEDGINQVALNYYFPQLSSYK